MRGILNGQSGGAKINGIIEEYVVQAGSNISAGDFVKFIADLAVGSSNVLANKYGTALRAELLSNTLLVIAYCDNTNGNYGCAKAISIVDEVVTEIGSEFIFYSGAVDTNTILISRVSNTKALLTFKVGSYNVYSVILSISGTVITKGTQVTTHTAGGMVYIVEQVSLPDANGDHILLTFTADSNAYAVILTVSGLAITVGAKTVLNPSSKNNMYWYPVVISSTCVICMGVYSTYAYGFILTISGTSITFGDAALVCVMSNGFSTFKMLKMEGPQAILAYIGNSGAYFQTLTVNGTTLTFTSEQLYISNNYATPEMFAKISSSKYILIHAYDNSRHYAYTIFDRLGTGIIKGVTYTWQTTYSAGNIRSFVVGSTILSIFNDGTNIRNTPLNIIKYVDKSFDRSLIQGVAKSKGSSGQSIPVYTLT